jgi:hypothetical protein
MATRSRADTLLSKLSHRDMLFGPTSTKSGCHERKGEEMTIATTEPTITEHEASQVERANALRTTPVVFVHGLWLLPSSGTGG